MVCIMHSNVHMITDTEGIMSSLNRVTLIGHLGADPETRVFGDGTMVCNLRIATSESWKDRVTGAQKEATEWHRVVLYRRLAETADQYLRKGSQVYVEGKLRTKKWIDKTGTDRYTTEIEGDELKMLGKPNQEVPSTSPKSARQTSLGGRTEERLRVQPQPVCDPLEDDRIPF